MRRALAFALAAVLAASCTGGDRDRSRPSPTSRPEQRRGGELRVGVTRIGSLDPAQARTVEQQLVADQLFDGLTAAHPETLEPQPSLAARWESTPDLKQWDFFLREGATFSDGRPVAAEDVVATLERVRRPEVASAAADVLSLVSSMAVPSPGVVRVVLSSPLAVLPSVLSSPVLGVVPREGFDAQAPVGSGPFSFGRVDGDVIEVRPVAGRGGAVESVLFRQFDDVGSSYRAFQRGELDWTRVPPEHVADATRRYGSKAFKPYLAELFYGFNLKNPKFADPRFREAIVRAIDRRAIGTAIYASTVLPLDGIVVAGVPGAQENACGDRCKHDVAAARSLAAAVFGDAGPPEVFLDYDADQTQEAVAKAIQAGLADAGIKATLRAKPLSEYQSFAVSGQQELFRLGWIGAYPSPDAFLPPLVGTGAPSNLTGFSSPAVDQALAAARAEPDPVKRAELYRTAEREVMAQLPVIPIAQFQVHSVVAPRVRRLTPTATGTFDASVVWLAGAP